MPGLSPSLEINRGVRRILVSKWIDLGRLSIHTTKNSVLIRGCLQKLPGSDAQLSAEYLEVIYKKIQEIENVQVVTIQLDNWIRNGATGSWQCIEAGAQPPSQTKMPEAPSSATATFEIRSN